MRGRDTACSVSPGPLPVVAIIDDQRGAALAREASARAPRPLRRARAKSRRSAPSRSKARPPACDDDLALDAADDLPDRQRVEEFVGDEQQRALAGRSAMSSCQRPCRQPLGLRRAQRRAGLDEMRPRRRKPARAHRPQRIGGQRAAARAELGIDGVGRRCRRAASRSASAAPTSSPNIWLISGAVVKSPPRRADRGSHNNARCRPPYRPRR